MICETCQHRIRIIYRHQGKIYCKKHIIDAIWKSQIPQSTQPANVQSNECDSTQQPDKDKGATE